MREQGNLPEVRDFPTWKEERRGWFTSDRAADEEDWLLPGGKHLRVVAQPLPDGGLLPIFEDRPEQIQLASARDTLLRVRTATFDHLFEAIGVATTSVVEGKSGAVRVDRGGHRVIKKKRHIN